MRKVAFPRLGSTGRLGNQLHQIAATAGIAHTRHAVPRFPYWPYEEFFSCPPEWFVDDEELRGAMDATKLARRLGPRARLYLQDLRLWKAIEDDVRRWFEPSLTAKSMVNKELANLLGGESAPWMAIHVRRGDTATHNPPNTIQPLDREYYLRAVASINNFPGGFQPVVFTDDVEWCREAFDGEDFRYYEGAPQWHQFEEGYDPDAPLLDWLDLFLMARASAHVISNSTYGWWGAWLAWSLDVRYPSRWYGPAMRGFDSSLQIPDGWVKIDAS